MSETEGVTRDPLSFIPMPKPQTYHTYCQICNLNYEHFDEHIKSDSYLRKARRYPNLAQIDDLIKDMETETKWLDNWKPEERREKRLVK